ALSPSAGLIETRRSGVGLAAARAAAVPPAVWPAPRPPPWAAGQKAPCPPPWTASKMPAVHPPTARTAPDAQATVFRDMLLTVLPLLLCAMLVYHALPPAVTLSHLGCSLRSEELCLGRSELGGSRRRGRAFIMNSGNVSPLTPPAGTSERTAGVGLVNHAGAGGSQSAALVR